MSRQTHEERLEALEAEMKAMRKDTLEARASAKETHDAVQAIVNALLEPQPGHDKSLLDRIAIFTIRAERGEWMLRFLIWLIGAGITVLGAWAGFKAWAAGWIG